MLPHTQIYIYIYIYIFLSIDVHVDISIRQPRIDPHGHSRPPFVNLGNCLQRPQHHFSFSCMLYQIIFASGCKCVLSSCSIVFVLCVMSVQFVLSVFCFSFYKLFFLICSTSPPGGNQVDGLPPAASLISDMATWLKT